jgi:hypothetical protein
MDPKSLLPWVHQWPPPWARLIQSIPQPFISLRSISVLPYTYILGLPSCLFYSGFPPKPYIHSSLPHACYMPHSSNILTHTMQSKEQIVQLMSVKIGLNLVPAKGAKIKVKWFQTFCVTENLVELWSLSPGTPFHATKWVPEGPIKQGTMFHLKCGTARVLILKRGCTTDHRWSV